MKKSTEELLNILKKKKSFDEYLSEEPEFIDTDPRNYLEKLLKEKQTDKSQVIRSSGLDRNYAYQLFSGVRNPTRDKLLALGFGFGLNVEETQQMLKVLGFPALYVKNKRDSILLFCIDRKVELGETNELLYEMGEEVLQ